MKFPTKDLGETGMILFIIDVTFMYSYKDLSDRFENFRNKKKVVDKKFRDL